MTCCPTNSSIKNDIPIDLNATKISFFFCSYIYFLASQNIFGPLTNLAVQVALITIRILGLIVTTFLFVVVIKRIF